MIKVRVVEDFTLGAFDKIKIIERSKKDIKGSLFVGDIFECTEDMAEYLIKTNKKQRAFVEIIEIIPPKEEKLTENEKKSQKVDKKVEELSNIKKSTIKKSKTSTKKVAKK